MPTRYSQLAIDFQKSIRIGALFRVYDDPEYTAHRGETLTVRAVLKETTNPDDWLYKVTDSNGAQHEIRAWWLRRCAARVD